jgi:hypothetical protein
MRLAKGMDEMTDCVANNFTAFAFVKLLFFDLLN